LVILLESKGWSSGVMIEAGWASAMRTPIVVLCPGSVNLDATPILQGLTSLTEVHVVRHDDTLAGIEGATRSACRMLAQGT